MCKEGKQSLSAQLSIMIRGLFRAAQSGAVFWEVVDDLHVMTDAANYHPVNDEIVTDCGVVLQG